MVYNWLNRLQQSLYPPTCVLCGAEGAHRRDLCEGCYAELPHNAHCCALCALPLPAEGHGLICGRCTRKRPLFDQCLAAFHYSNPADELVLDLKFRQRLVCARLLGELLADHLLVHRAAEPLPRVLIPVPLHPRRLRERGFNQAIELARPIAKRLGIPLAHSLCRRDRLTPLQTGLSALARRRNLRGAFSVAGSIQSPHVALIDDVVTTGSTANELARLLKRNGVERVEVWAACRTPQPQSA